MKRRDLFLIGLKLRIRVFYKSFIFTIFKFWRKKKNGKKCPLDMDAHVSS